MNLKTIFTKTGKGMLEMKNKALPKDISRILTLVDGKSSVGNLLDKDDKLTEGKLREMLKKLEDDGYIRIFSTGPETIFQADLDFTKGKGGMVVSEVKADVYNEAKAKQAQSQPPPRVGATQPPPRPGGTQPPPRPGLTQPPPRQGLTQPPPKPGVTLGPSIHDLARAEAEARAKRESEEKIKKEAEARAKAEAEARAKKDAEAKGKADAEARLRSEAEAKVRREVEAKAKAEAEARTTAEADAKAKRELEERLRAEAEARARAEAEAKAKAEAQAKAKAEAEARTKRELEERLRAEAEARARAEAEAKAKAEAQAKAKADAEAKAKAEAEARAKAAEEAKAQAELRAKEEAAAKARIEAEVKSKLAAEARSKMEAEARAKKEAEEKIQAEERRKKEEAALRAKFEQEAKAKIEEEARIKKDAEARAKAELKRREESKSDADRHMQAEIEAQLKLADEPPPQPVDEDKIRKEARAKAEEAAWAKAEAEIRASIQESAKKEAKAKPGWMEEAEKEEERRQAREREEFEAKERAKAEEKARAEAEALRVAKAKAKAEEEAKERAVAKKSRGRRKPIDWKPVAAIVGVLLVAAIGLVNFIPFNNYIPRIEKLASETLHEPVTINSLHINILPSPQVKLEGLTVGTLKDIKIETITVSGLDLVLSESTQLDSVEADTTTLQQDALLRVARWGKPAGGAPGLQIARVSFRNVRLLMNKIPLAPLQGTIGLAKDGTVRQASLRTSDGKITAEVAAKDQLYEVTASARNWQLPLGPELAFDSVEAHGTATSNGMQLSKIEAKLYGGSAKGTADIHWGNGWGLSGNFEAGGLELAPVIVIFARNFIASGTLDTRGRYSMQAKTPEGLFEAPRVEGSFNVSRGSLNNMDLTRALQEPSRNGVRGGKTLFTDFTGNLIYSGGGYQFKDLRLVSGPLSATGSAEITSGNILSGRVNVELKSGATSIKNSFAVSGSINDLVLRSN